MDFEALESNQPEILADNFDEEYLESVIEIDESGIDDINESLNDIEGANSPTFEIDEEDTEEPKRALIKCPLCIKEFTTEEGVKKHLMKFHRFSAEKVNEFGAMMFQSK